MNRPAITIRLRLTLLYGILFFLAGAVLLTINYAFSYRNLPAASGIVTVSAGPASSLDTAVAFPLDSAQIPGELVIESDEAFSNQSPPPEVEAEMNRLVAGAQKFRDDTLRQLLIQSSIALLATAAASIALGWFAAGRVLRPIHEITAAARNLSEQNLSARLNLGGPNDELRELGDTFDEMLDRLSLAFENQQRFIANASHELRTPLSIIRTVLETSGDLAPSSGASPESPGQGGSSTSERLLPVVDRAEHAIEALLVLATSSSTLIVDEPVDLADVVDVALAEHETEIADTQLDLITDLSPAPTRGDGVLLEHLAANLVTNAARYNTNGGSISVATYTDGENSVLEISNSGPVIAPDLVPSLLEPFRRNAPDRTKHRGGSGLGLSIVGAVATAHHGTVDVTAPPTGGLHIIVRLPRQHSSAHTSPRCG